MNTDDMSERKPLSVPVIAGLLLLAALLGALNNILQPEGLAVPWLGNPAAENAEDAP